MRASVLPAVVLACTLTGCSMPGGAMLQWVSETGFGHIGTSVVCLGSDLGEDAGDAAQIDGSYRFSGTVLSEGPAPESDFSNVDACWGAPSRALAIQDQDGHTWMVGYRWESNSIGDTTPAIKVSPGETVTLTYRSGSMEGSAGFAVHNQDEGLLYAMESGRGTPGLEPDDVPELAVTPGEIVGSEDLDCGRIAVRTMDFETDSGDSAQVGPGEDTPLQVDADGRTLTLCNINAVEVPQTCEDHGYSERSWVVFNPRQG